MNAKNAPKGAILLLAVLAVVIMLGPKVEGVPSGAQVGFVSQDTGPTFTAGNRSDDGGTINTISLNSTQQNPKWKAYIGNVSGSLTLDDANQNTIYDWTLSSISGEVYVSRDSDVNWSTGSINCSDQATIDNEQSFIGGTSSDDDSINSTYDQTQHAAMQVGGNAISNSTCRTAYTYINDVSQTASENNNFTAILLEDSGNDNLIYATFIANNVTGFDNQNYDFQVIVPDQANSSIVTYYFYLEIGS